MKIKTSELQGAALDWAVAQCEGIETKNYSGALTIRYDGDWWQPSTDWSQGGPIIERERISTQTTEDHWDADLTTESGAFIQSVGDTPLIAAMRCYVASKLGDEVEMPPDFRHF